MSDDPWADYRRHADPTRFIRHDLFGRLLADYDRVCAERDKARCEIESLARRLAVRYEDQSKAEAERDALRRPCTCTIEQDRGPDADDSAEQDPLCPAHYDRAYALQIVAERDAALASERISASERNDYKTRAEQWKVDADRLATDLADVLGNAPTREHIERSLAAHDALAAQREAGQ